MTKIMKRSMALLVALFLCLSLLPVNLVTVDSATYIYNWGSRGTTATFLSQEAQAFYTGNNTYDTLSTLSGGTSKADVPNSELYYALQDLMADAHSYKTSYDATKNLYKYTDCQNGGGKISSFYSGTAIGPDWDGSWNREHTWPNSKGLGGQDENDIMMLRPTSTTENSARGNKAYGQSSGYYNPNSESGGKLDLRGDVARIFLYVYVRWGNVNGNGEYTTWGTKGVMESPEVMLQWIEADPVDTWELGRNDSVQSITGTRNVFVDYPELAFLLFGEEVPNDMTTPSGEAANAVNCQHNYVPGKVVLPTCTTDGYTVYTCSLCSKSYEGDKVAAAHKFVEGICSVCGKLESGVVDTPVPGTAYKFGLTQVTLGKDLYFAGIMDGNFLATTEDINAATDVYIEKVTGGYRFYFLDGQTKNYIDIYEYTSGKAGVRLTTTPSAVFVYNEELGVYTANVAGADRYLGTYNSYSTISASDIKYISGSNAANVGVTQFVAKFILVGGSGNPEVPSCEHTNTAVQGAVEATCTTNGHTGKTVCSDCGTVLDAGSVIPAPGHSYTNGVCNVCGEQESTGSESGLREGVAYTISADNATGTLWFNGTVTNGRFDGSYDESEAVSVYAKNVNGGFLLYFLDGEAKQYICMDDKSAGGSFSTDAASATVFEWNAEKETAAVAEDSNNRAFGCDATKTYTNFSCYDLSGNYNWGQFTPVDGGSTEPDDPTCQHTNTTVEGAKEATCTENGHTGKTVCSDCGEVIDNGKVIPAPGHNYENGICDRCGAEIPQYNVHFLVPSGVDAVASMVCGPQGIQLPTAGTVEGYTFLGWVTSAVDNVTDKVEFLSAGESYVAQQDVILYALYSYEKEAPGGETTSGTATISFADKAQRTEYSTTKQVWAQNGITVTNLKAESTSSVGDYADPVRFYANASLQIEYPGMTQIEFVCGGSNYATALMNSIPGSAIDGSNVTVTFTAAQDSLDIAKLSAQVRVKSITVTYSAAAPAGPVTYYTTVIGDGCTHSNTTVDNKDATCTEPGYKNMLICADCQTVLVNGEEVAALGHDMIRDGEIPATCTEPGYQTSAQCSRCNYTESGGEIPALGHEAGAEATCEAAQTCVRCDYVYAEALGHEAGAEATCETAQTCVRCDYVFAAALGHEGEAATCETAQFCTRCNQVVVAALGHEAGAQATCNTAQTCIRCDYEYEPALGHDIRNYAASAPTCTQSGWKAYQACTRCSYSTYSAIAATGHSNKSTVTEPTCTEEGYTTNVCTVCNAVSKTNIVEAGHKLIQVKAKAATTEAEGNFEYWSCEACQGIWTDETCTISTTKEAVTLPKLETPATEATTDDTTDPTADTTTVGATDDEDGNSKTSLILLGGLAGLLVLAVVVVLGMKKFGKK